MSSRLRYWPVVTLGVAFLVGTVLSGVGGGVIFVTLAFLIVAPGYLLQNAIRRRRGVAPSQQGLGQDADVFFSAAARSYLGVLHRHPALRLLILGLMAMEVLIVWRALGGAWAVFALALPLASVTAGVVARSFRR